ncbi:MAG TPA: folate-binding protein [Acidobacteriaceae bacterium]|nr:folate-binding protein [Acidobacteriaceae bacterium]
MDQNLQAELDAILHGAAVASLDDRAFLRVTGSDATRWLNGMVTNSVQALGPGEGCYAFLLNAQGRILGDCTIYREPDGAQPAFVLATSKQQIDAIQKHLDHFIIMDDVELTPMKRYNHTALIIGPEAPQVLRKMENATAGCRSFADTAPLRLQYYPQTTSQLITPAEGQVSRFEISPSFPVDDLFKEAKAAGAIEVSPEALEALRLLEGRPLYGRDITDKYLPQETNQPQALHFNKGCYLGQEIVERIRSRGQVHRLLTPLTLSGELPTEFPAPIQADGKSVGEITSAALVPLPGGDQVFALGYVRREVLDTHAPLTYSGGTVAPRSTAQVQTVAGASK